MNRKEVPENVELPEEESKPISQGRREFLKTVAAAGAGAVVGTIGGSQIEKGINKGVQAENESNAEAAGFADAGRFELGKGIRDLAGNIEELERYIDEQEKASWSGSSFVTMAEKFAVISSETYRLGTKISVMNGLKQVDKAMLDKHQSVLELKRNLEDRIEKIKGKYQVKLERR